MLRLITLIGLLIQAAVFVFAPAGLVQLGSFPNTVAHAANMSRSDV